MATTTTIGLAEHIIGILRAHEAELRRAGLRHLSLFGSAARDDAGTASDIDLVAEFDSDARAWPLWSATCPKSLAAASTSYPNQSRSRVFGPTSIRTVSVPSKHDPAHTLLDIIENAERIEAYLAHMDRRAFEEDGRTRDAVERCLERICEAAYRLGRCAAELMPSQPWSDVRGMGEPAATRL